MTGEAKWVGFPRSYTPGRARPIQYVTLHYTAGSEGSTSAENSVAYDKVRTDGTSAHYYVDSLGPPLQEVPDGSRAHTARWHANEVGVHVEICGTRQTRAQWLDATSKATLRTTARLVADLCKAHNLPAKRLTVAQTRAAYYAAPGSRPKGINDHWDCTRAYPEDQGDHTDVGEAFPWDVFMDMVTTEMEGDMPLTDAEKKEIAQLTAERVWTLDSVPQAPDAPKPPHEDPDYGDPDNPDDGNKKWAPKSYLRRSYESTDQGLINDAALSARVDELHAKVDALAPANVTVTVTEQQIVDAVKRALREGTDESEG